MNPEVLSVTEFVSLSISGPTPLLVSVFDTVTVDDFGAGGGYGIISISYAPFTLDGSAIELTLQDDDVSAGIALPFSFTFYGSVKNTVYIGSNGLIGFNDPAGDGNLLANYPYDHTPIPDPPSRGPTTPGNAVFGFWQDLNPTLGSNTIKYETFGSAPDRTFVVEYYNMPQYNNEPERLTMQIHLKENGQIEFHTLHGSSVGNDTDGEMVQGIQNDDGTLATYLGDRNLATNLTINNDAVRILTEGACINIDVFSYQLPLSVRDFVSVFETFSSGIVDGVAQMPLSRPQGSMSNGYLSGGSVGPELAIMNGGGL